MRIVHFLCITVAAVAAFKLPFSKKPAKAYSVFDCTYKQSPSNPDKFPYPPFRITDVHTQSEALNYAKMAKSAIKVARQVTASVTKHKASAKDFTTFFSPSEHRDVLKIFYQIAHRSDPVVLGYIDERQDSLKDFGGLTMANNADSVIEIKRANGVLKRDAIRAILHELSHHYGTEDHAYMQDGMDKMQALRDTNDAHKNADSVGMMGQRQYESQKGIVMTHISDFVGIFTRRLAMDKGRWTCVESSGDEARRQRDSMVRASSEEEFKQLFGPISEALESSSTDRLVTAKQLWNKHGRKLLGHAVNNHFVRGKITNMLVERLGTKDLAGALVILNSDAFRQYSINTIDCSTVWHNYHSSVSYVSAVDKANRQLFEDIFRSCKSVNVPTRQTSSQRQQPEQQLPYMEFAKMEPKPPAEE